VVTWRAVRAHEYAEVCLDFGMTCFEFLVLCVSVGRFRELGGFAVCCGEPGKGVLLVGGDGGRHRPDPSVVRSPQHVFLHMGDDFPSSSNLEKSPSDLRGGRGNQRGSQGRVDVSHSYNTRNGANGSQRGPSYVPPHHPSHNVALTQQQGDSSDSSSANAAEAGQNDESSSGFFSESGETSQISSASSSYNHGVGRGYLAFPQATRSEDLFGTQER
jgi:hypothetical protein